MQKLLMELDAIGINTIGGLQRFNFDQEVYLGFIEKFLNDQSFTMLDYAIKNKDYNLVLIYSSAMQGIASNLGFVSIESKCNGLSNAVYYNKKINKEYEDLKKVYFKTVMRLLIVFKGRYL